SMLRKQLRNAILRVGRIRNDVCCGKKCSLDFVFVSASSFLNQCERLVHPWFDYAMTNRCLEKGDSMVESFGTNEDFQRGANCAGRFVMGREMCFPCRVRIDRSYSTGLRGRLRLFVLPGRRVVPPVTAPGD